MTTHLATLFDKKYVLRALSLYESAQVFLPENQFWFLCLDQVSFDLLASLGLKNTHLKKLVDINDRELLAVRSTRPANEFAFTCKSAWVNYILESSEVRPDDMLIWADADILFFTEATDYIDKLQRIGSIGITPHGFSKEKEKQFGRYNAGMIFFKNDQNTKVCIKEWRQQCLESCKIKREEGKLGDQMYLDAWPQKYARVYDIVHPGVNLGTWNIHKYKIRKSGEGKFLVANEPLICYHFHGLQFYLARNKKIKPYPINVYHNEIYRHYTHSLQKSYEKVLQVDPGWQYEFASKPDVLRLIKQKILKMFR